MEVKSITEVFALISSLIAVSVLFLKASNELLLNIIKVKYESIPGQKSLFSMTVTMIGSAFIVLEIILIVIGIFSAKFVNNTVNQRP